ncbi:N-6 DNA methylase [uncultured Thiodictyon sp.]|uniref:HsdM family class I SAM-dependent methyltransferase n=1 Tax=uncultured Thiodictyon sp. TaxID=1846217 RepID=UPI0025F09A3F|nr:N-6 DNA methylase [uncultured Thiodictyon sp.]
MEPDPAAPPRPGDPKSRGAYFTPTDVARFIAVWAIRGAADRVLEPSCGEAAFLTEAVVRLRELGLTDTGWPAALHGHEIHRETAAVARQLLAGLGAAATIAEGDFFVREARPEFDAVIGNPPYVRYQHFSGEARARALAAALRQGVRLSGLASSWAAFVVHAGAFLKPEGRLGLVLPAELLSVKYATEIRHFLLRRFARVRLVLFDHLVFPGVLEDVVLLLAQGSGGTDHFEVYQAARPQDLMQSLAQEGWTGFHPRPDTKWTSALLPAEVLALYGAVSEGDGFEPMARWGGSFLGSVTGNNGFFALSPARAAALRLPAHELLAISPPGGRHLMGLHFDRADWERLGQAGAATLLFAPGETPTAAARRYIAQGKREGVSDAYKCRVRSPWWRVPLVDRPDLFCTYMNHRRPRLLANQADALVLNSIYGVRLTPSRRDLGRRLLPLAALNSLSLLGAEIGGRVYGGGMLKHEPREIDALPVPSITLVTQLAAELEALLPEVERLLGQGDETRATARVDDLILRHGLGLAREALDTLRAAREYLLDRRLTRGRGTHG